MFKFDAPIAMIKKSTGLVLTPNQYRSFEQCVMCSKASEIPYKGKCEDCVSIDFKYCEICEKVLRGGLHKFYSYDNRDIHRDVGISFLASKENVREFVFEEMLPDLQDGQTKCYDCIDFEKRVKDICFWCDNDFTNSVENYKINGNSCKECVAIFSKQGLNNARETR